MLIGWCCGLILRANYIPSPHMPSPALWPALLHASCPKHAPPGPPPLVRPQAPWWQWVLSTGACVRTFQGHGASIPSVCVDPSGTWLITGSAAEKPSPAPNEARLLQLTLS